MKANGSTCLSNPFILFFYYFFITDICHFTGLIHGVSAKAARKIGVSQAKLESTMTEELLYAVMQNFI